MPWPKSTKTVRVPKANLHSAGCPTRIILDDVMSRWGSLVLVILLEQSYRFSELAYLIGGVSEKMLAQTLRRLEMDGFVRREVHATKPPKVEYSLTPLGRELGVHVQALLSFVHKNANRVLKSRDKAREREAGSVIA
ncbi:MAG TPA: helix-turn-helix domain-containing protein [Granulicella sp.]|jgi:DNA-binding HxlR family transcriptional regulator